MADSMTGELKRALVEIVTNGLIYGTGARSAKFIVDGVLASLAEGSPEVIEAMWEAFNAPGSDAGPMRAALAAGMKVIAEGGK